MSHAEGGMVLRARIDFAKSDRQEPSERAGLPLQPRRGAVAAELRATR